MLDIIDPMNVGKTFVERNERRKFQRFFITSYFLNTQTTVKSRDVATLERKQEMPVGTDRNGLLAAGPDLAGYQFTIRLAGFCRTKTGVWRVKYKAAGTCRKI